MLRPARIPSFAALAAVFALAGLPATAQAAGPQVTVSGGGTASFDFVEGLESQFSVGAVIHDDGSVEGHFMCMIVGIVAISGHVTDGTLNADGSVTLSGVGHGIVLIPEVFGPFEDCPFEVTLWQGGPGVGRFFYSDCVAVGDAETVESGHIMIKVH
ncbi:MAG: hypothetical protein WD278_18685 [Pirellulales bacterium]